MPFYFIIKMKPACKFYFISLFLISNPMRTQKADVFSDLLNHELPIINQYNVKNLILFTPN